MSESKLKTAVLGLDSKGLLLLEAALKTDYFAIAAVADKDTKLAERTALKYNCTGYDDYRRLIIQNQFDCLLVAGAIHTCDEYVKMAVKKKTNILKLAPLARNFQEAVELARLADDENVKFAVANPGRFAGSFLALRDFLQQNQNEQFFFTTAFCSAGSEGIGDWQTDPKLAGGGVLLHNCYEIIDQIVWNLATPEMVYCLNTNTAGDRQQRSYLTEDTAVVTMKFTDSFFGNLTASSKVFGKEQKILKLYGKDKILTASNAQFVISDGAEQTSEKSEYDDDEFARHTALLKNFALSILSPDNNKLCSSARENLNNMAVIEAAYLSARTGMPEEPGKILKMAHAEPANIRLT
ncbi:MAG: Gfo/Idh/MocA family oxidoreductase [Phycisphaerae bacterium]|jgi:predicted dehydrogenase